MVVAIKEEEIKLIILLLLFLATQVKGKHFKDERVMVISKNYA